MVEITVVAGDIMSRPCQLMLLKHADGFFGVDRAVSDKIEFRSGVEPGAAVVVTGKNIEALNVLFLGVGPLVEFRYPDLRHFASKALSIAKKRGIPAEIICTPIHGPGYGLDERESFLSLLAGFLDAIEKDECPRELRRIEFVEISPTRALRMENALREVRLRWDKPRHATIRDNLSSFGQGSERKAKLFVAMPFSPEHSDVWDIAIQEACQTAELLCERVDQQAYTGDVLAQIKSRLSAASGVLAVLDGANPNVFLEVGFAWALEKPTVLIVRNTENLPFDVRAQKCLIYSSIANLRTLLKDELVALRKQGAFEERGSKRAKPPH